MEEDFLMALPCPDHQYFCMVITKHIIFKLKNGKLILNINSLEAHLQVNNAHCADISCVYPDSCSIGGMCQRQVNLCNFFPSINVDCCATNDLIH